MKLGKTIMAFTTLVGRFSPARSFRLVAITLRARSFANGDRHRAGLLSCSSSSHRFATPSVRAIQPLAVRLYSRKESFNFDDFKVVDMNWKPGDDEGEGEELDTIGDIDSDMEARIAHAMHDSKKGRVSAPIWLANEQLSPQKPECLLQIEEGQCAGCGIKLQMTDAELPGFLPAERESNQPAAPSDALEGEVEGTDEEVNVVCQRCFRLRNYGKVQDSLRPGWSNHDALSPAAFKSLLSGLANKRCVVVTLVDVFDFHGSILPDLQALVGKNPLFVAVNKVDLLPSGFSTDRVKKWVLNECRDFGNLDRLRLSDIFLVSAKSGLGVQFLLEEARDLAEARKCDVFVVGAANVGKSSMLNRLSDLDGGQSGARKQPPGKPKKKMGITTSSLPGTTLQFLKLDVGKGVQLVDTPGLILAHQLTSLLLSEELKAVFPVNRAEHLTLRVGEGKSVMLGGLARMEFVQGLPFFFTFFLAPGVVVHTSSHVGAEADAFVAKHTGGLLTPPFAPERAAELAAQLVTHDIDVQGCGWGEASCDIVLSGLGWISVTGAGSCKIRVVAPAGVMIVQREPLMPFEARDSMAKATGGRIVKNSVKKANRAKRGRSTGGPKP